MLFSVVFTKNLCCNNSEFTTASNIRTILQRKLQSLSDLKFHVKLNTVKLYRRMDTSGLEIESRENSPFKEKAQYSVCIRSCNTQGPVSQNHFDLNFQTLSYKLFFLGNNNQKFIHRIKITLKEKRPIWISRTKILSIIKRFKIFDFIVRNWLCGICH